MKKVIILFLAILFLGVAGFFFYRGYIVNEWKYTENTEGNIVIQGYNGRTKNLVIPSEINGKPVTEVNTLEYAHKSTKEKIESVKIPGSVELIYNSFIEMPNLKSVILGDGIKWIWSGSFRDCKALTEIDIPDSVEKIGTADAQNTRGSFSGCSSLANVNINVDMTELNGSSFEGTPWLEEVKDGETYAVISDRVIGGGGAEGSVIIDKGSKVADMAFVDNDKITDVTIGGNINTIEFAAYWDCDNLKSVVIEDGVRNIKALAFDSCDSLEVITIPDSVQFIEDNAIGKENIKIICSAQSAAYEYAVENGIDYEITEGNLPEEYSSLEDGCVTEIKSQLRGDCWAYACCTTIDINNQKLYGDRLLYPSDDIVTNCIGDRDRWPEGRILPDYMDEFEIGGRTYDLCRLFAYGYDGHILKDMNMYEGASVEDIKRAVQKYGAVQIGISDRVYPGPEGYMTLYALPNTVDDHSVVIVGWNDNYSKDNFHDNPEHDGAWLAQNSHGDKWSKGGFYWISYDSLLYEVSCFDLKKADAEVLGHAYSSNLTVSTGDTTTGASVFNHEGTLNAVGFVTVEPKTNVKVEIYNNDFSELLYSEEAFYYAKGYHLIELSEPQTVSSCAVAVTVDNELAVEGPGVESIIDPYITGSSPGESYILIENEWVDVTSSDIKSRLGIEKEPNNCFITAVYEK